VVNLFTSGASAASVVCDPAEATRIVLDARVDPRRVPVTHPWLVPGVARAQQDPGIARLLEVVCAPGADLVVERAEQWEAPTYSAYDLVVVRIEQVGCSLVRRRAGLTVGIGADGPVYRPGRVLPDESTPVGDCTDQARWREDVLLAGAGTDVRLLRIEDHVGDAVVHTQLAVRRATRTGWTEQVLVEPAPPRTLDPEAAGPLVALVEARDGKPMIVATRDRTFDAAGACVSAPGQTVWHEDGSTFSAEDGRSAAARLAREGAWRWTGQDGWFLILGQDDESDAGLVEPRRRRIQRRFPEPLSLWTSADFSLLTPGYVFVAPDPWPTEQEADAARAGWGAAYPKRAWVAPDGCAP
jgi:hypothetical protein